MNLEESIGVGAENQGSILQLCAPVGKTLVKKKTTHPPLERQKKREI